MKAGNSRKTGRRGVLIAGEQLESLNFAFLESSTPDSDFGIDAYVELIEQEEATGKLLALQVKSGASYFTESNGSGYVFRLDRGHFEYWQHHSLPVVICLCDIQRRVVYWEVANSDTIECTGVGYKLQIPYSNRIDLNFSERFKKISIPVIPTGSYTILKTEDVSHNAAKRYSFEIVLKLSMTEFEISHIVRRVTEEGKQRKYYRNSLGRERWGDSKTHVVWTFIYLNEEDRRQRNHFCRSAWLSEDIDPQFAPQVFSGDDAGGGIVIDWNENYRENSVMLSESVLLKEEYLEISLPLADEFIDIQTSLQSGLEDLSRCAVDEISFLDDQRPKLQRLDKIYEELRSIGRHPIECQEFHERFTEIIALLHNVTIYFSETGLQKWDERSRIRLSSRCVADAGEKLVFLQYELEKIR